MNYKLIIKPNQTWVLSKESRWCGEPNEVKIIDVDKTTVIYSFNDGLQVDSLCMKDFIDIYRLRK